MTNEPDNVINLDSLRLPQEPMRRYIKSRKGGIANGFGLTYEQDGKTLVVFGRTDPEFFNSVDCRELAAWLTKAADFMDRKNK
jgi:hypothetical protein